MLTTRQKVIVARFIAATLLSVRRIFGQGPEVAVTRVGVNWRLDLREGIDLAIYLWGFERQALSLYNRIIKPGMTVLDIGANIGFHTLHLAHRVGTVGKVFAIEPTSFAFAKLDANLALNLNMKSVVVTTQAFLTERNDDGLKSEIPASWPVSGNDKVDEMLMSKTKSTEGAQALTLDSFIAKHEIIDLDFIKLDVDGHELSVLTGGEESLKRLKPLLYMEIAPYVHDSQNFIRLIDKLTSLGYGCVTHSGEVPKKLNAADYLQDIPFGSGLNVLLQME